MGFFYRTVLYEVFCTVLETFTMDFLEKNVFFIISICIDIGLNLETGYLYITQHFLSVAKPYLYYFGNYSRVIRYISQNLY